MIHVCFGLYDKTGRYSKFTGTTILSMFENTNSDVTVHILHDNTLSQDNRDKFIYLAGKYSQTVKFYNVEQLCADKLTNIDSMFPNAKKTRYTLATFYRFFIPDILPVNIEKCIYLDSDIIVNLDIAELWCVNLGDKILGAIPEVTNKDKVYMTYSVCLKQLVKREDYFNAGVLLINLQNMRVKENILMNGIRFISEDTQSMYLDQDVLNYCFAKENLKLPAKFNRLVKWCKLQGENYISNKIYHYINGNTIESFNLDMRDPFSRLWMEYFMKTPWFDVDTIGRLYAGFQQIHIRLKNSMLQLSTMMLGKSRAFFVAPNSLDAMKKIFSIRNDEKIIRAENNESLKKLIDAMKKSHGKKVFFILLPNFPFQILIQAGFVYGKDFINGFEFLSEANGVPLDSHQLIKAM